MSPDVTQVHAYYRAALAALSYVEQARPTGRRFGPEADARWAAVRGGLGASDRIDLLLRDASAEWPASFGARATFDFDAVAEDDAFGRDWPGLDGVTGERLFRDAAASPPADVASALRAMAGAWNITLSPPDAPTPDPRTRFIVAGSSAVVALAAAFATAPDARWTSQVITVADAPATRQLAAAVPALLNQHGTSMLIRSSSPVSAAFASARRLVSPDAGPAEAVLARAAT